MPKTKVSPRQKMSRSGTNKALKSIKSANKFELKKQKFEQKIKRQEQKNEFKAIKNRSRELKEQARRTGNAVQRGIQAKIDLKRAKMEADKAGYEAQAANKKLDPELRKLEKQTESQVKIERAKTAGKVGAYTALAKGGSDLGRGLIDEGNRDRDSEYKSLSDNLEKIFGTSGSDNKEKDETTGDGLSEGVE